MIKRDISRVLHNIDLAGKRISRTGGLYGIHKVHDLILSRKDISLAESAIRQEREIVYNGSDNFDLNGLKRGVVYCLLSTLQKFEGHINAFNCLYTANLRLLIDLNDTKRVAEVLRSAGIMFYNQKAERIKSTSETITAQTLELITQSIRQSREQEVDLRSELVTKKTGLGLKTCSMLLRMSGAQFLVPMDNWMTEMLYFHGYPCEMPRTKITRKMWRSDNFTTQDRKTGLKGDSYLEAEEFALDLAQKYEIPGYLLQMAFYTTRSSFTGTEFYAKYK